MLITIKVQLVTLNTQKTHLGYTTHSVNCKPFKHNVTYRNSCLAVLVGDVGKSSSLRVKIGRKQNKNKAK